MKTLKVAAFLAAMVVLSTAYAQKGTLVFPRPPHAKPPPKDYTVEPPPPPLATLKDQPKPTAAPAPAAPTLVTPEQAQGIISRFKEAYPKLGSPRFLIYVNRTLADKQSMRDMESFFGHRLRDAGATLTDEKVAAQVIGDKPLDMFIGSSDTPEARKDREALRTVADAVIEVVLASKDVSVPADSGSQTITIPEVQATAINLKDSKILGQASSSDMTGRVPPSTLGNLGVGDLAEATALALMDDMTPKP
jgi:hypothetical protein